LSATLSSPHQISGYILYLTPVYLEKYMTAQAAVALHITLKVEHTWTRLKTDSPSISSVHRHYSKRLCFRSSVPVVKVAIKVRLFLQGVLQGTAAGAACLGRLNRDFIRHHPKIGISIGLLVAVTMRAMPSAWAYLDGTVPWMSRNGSSQPFLLYRGKVPFQCPATYVPLHAYCTFQRTSRLQHQRKLFACPMPGQ
jgi:hypothetical protein